ncbi:MAG: GRP family sugar transporter [Holophagaceae bacterium]|nr:GRP family sugar transporter [Holophagaceae bacterium]
MILGIFFSVIVSILFAAYAIPRKFSKQNVILYTMWMGISYCAATIILVGILWGFGLEPAENLLSRWHLLTALRGIVWVFGMMAYNKAIDKIGLTRFNQWKNIQGPVGSLLILFIVTKDTSSAKTLWLLLGMTVMFFSAWLFQVETDAEKRISETLWKKENMRQGIAFALFSGICFGISALLNSIVSNVEIVGEKFTFAQLIYHSATLTIFPMALCLVVENKTSEPSKAVERFRDIIKVDKKTWMPVIAGGMYMVATLLTIYSYRLIPNNAIPWSITQLNVFWTVIIGIFIFKEIGYKQNWRRLTGGILMAAGACIFLFFAI